MLWSHGASAGSSSDLSKLRLALGDFCGCGSLERTCLSKCNDRVCDVVMRDSPQLVDFGLGDVRKEADAQFV